MRCCPVPCLLLTCCSCALSHTRTHAHCTRAQHSPALTLSRSLSFCCSSSAACKGQAKRTFCFLLFFPFFTLLFCWCVSLLCSPCLSLSLSFLHFLVCYTGNASQSLPDAAATAMQLVGADAGCAVVVAACIVFVCAQIKRNTKIKTKEMEGNYCCCRFKLKLFINLRLCNFISLSLSLSLCHSISKIV